MRHQKTIVRAAALVSSFGLIGTYVACQQNGGRLPGTGGPSAAAPATAPGAAAAGSTTGPAAPAVTPANFGTKSAILFKPDAPGQPTLMPGSKSGGIANPTLLSGSKSLVLTPTQGTVLLGGSKSSAVFSTVDAGTLTIAGTPATGTLTVPATSGGTTVFAPAAPATRPTTLPATRPTAAPATQPAARVGPGHDDVGPPVTFAPGTIDWNQADVPKAWRRPTTTPSGSRPPDAFDEILLPADD
ncbi:MAG TPA: hypothetical protein VF796_04965 [Humisphaera sp.]